MQLVKASIDPAQQTELPVLRASQIENYEHSLVSRTDPTIL